MLIMNKKKKKTIMKLPSLFFKSSDKSTWPWPSCRQPRTLSFRAAATDSSVDSFFTLSSESSGSLSTASDISGGGDPIERMIRGLRSSERLLIEPSGKSSSIMKENVNGEGSAALEKAGTAVVAMVSDDPLGDFRKSMEEMVEAHGMEDLEELLSWYLRVNATNNHGFIIAAFVDLLLTLAVLATDSSSTSSSSSSSSNLLPNCLSSSSMEIEDITSLLDHHHHHHAFS